MGENDGPEHVAYKSSVTGKFVTEQFAEEHPRSTYKTSIPDREVTEHNDDSEPLEAHASAALDHQVGDLDA
jgi:hypothetical protein